jgi:glycosyltransferase involved in cell wall biosynthesis
MACGLAVITTDVGGHNEIIVSGENGILINPKSSEEIKEALKTIFRDSEYTEKLKLNAAKEVAKIGTYTTNAVYLKELFLSEMEE